MGEAFDPIYANVAALSAAIHDGSLSVTELIDAQLTRIASFEPRLAAFALLLEERARATARRLDDELARGQWRGPLHGIPVAVKDLCAMRGLPNAAGTVVLAATPAQADATVVTRLERAGAVILGKSQLTEGAFSEHHPSIPAPVNPWHGEHWSGVSSSGSGVAVAAGMASLAIGTDTGGSIRYPCAANGLTGLKPSYGRVSRAGVFPLAESLDHVGPMARCAADAAAMLAVMAGPDGEDRTALRAPVPDYVAGIGRGLQGIRIGIDREYALDGVDAEVAGALQAGLEELAALGAEIVPVRLPDTRAMARLWTFACAIETAIAHEATWPSRKADYGPALSGLIELGHKLPAPEAARVWLARRAFTAQLEAVFEQIDLIACPTLTEPTPSLARIGERLGEEEATIDFLRFTAPYDLSGNPTVTFPNGIDRRGLPLSMQLIGRHLEEGLLLRAAEAFQRTSDWHTRRPAL